MLSIMINPQLKSHYIHHVVGSVIKGSVGLLSYPSGRNMLENTELALKEEKPGKDL